MSIHETILCIERAALPPSWVESMTAVALSEAAFYEQIPDRTVRFLNRKSVETDPCFKQIIPYLLLYDQVGNRFGCYQRKGTEARLHDLWSIGIGGHVSTHDRSSRSDSLKTIVSRGLYREMSEELIGIPSGSLQFLGLINEEVTSVGSVHLGLVFCLEVEGPEQIVPGEELYRFCWKSSLELAGLKLEHWSHLALRLSGG